ncbi:MAG: TrkH family potassium uptake protein [Candidatus Coprovivens sp.]
MKNKLIYKYVGKVLITFAILLLCPIIVSLVYKETILPFIIPAIISLVLGVLLNRLKPKNKYMYAKDGFLIVAISWILISLLSALPYVITKDASFIDALFESVSGLTTTSATIFKDVEKLSKSILFWRSLTVYIGGMGVLAFVMAIIPLSQNDKSMHVLKAEMPGPNVSKLVPSIKKTLFYLFGIYIGLTVIEMILLYLGGLSFYDSVLISFSTAGTGGFAQFNAGLANIGAFNQWVVTIFMFLFGINFNIYFLLIMKEFKTALKSEELKIYFIMCLIAVAFVVANTWHAFSTIGISIREAAFHVSSVITSTGFSIGDINIYPTSCRIIFLQLMLIGACAGSACGGFKISRLIICVKSIARDIIKTFKPNSVKIIKFEDKKVDQDTINSVRAYLFLYIIILLILVFIVSYDGYSLEITINAAFTTFANNGLAFGISSFGDFTCLSKISMTIGMLLGRLEIYPLLILFSKLKK